MQKKILSLFIICGILKISYADNGVAAAVAASLTTQAVNTGSAIYMQKNGMQPQYVNTPSGTFVVPGAPVQNTQPTAPAPSPPPAYDLQNQQDNKIQFINGNIVQSFPDLPPAATAGSH